MERNGPWGTNINQWEPQYIVRGLRGGGDTADTATFRPEVDRVTIGEELAALLELCWAEDPRLEFINCDL